MYGPDNTGRLWVTAIADIIFLSATSPPRGIMFDDVMAAAKNLSDMTLAHEIAVNENFQLRPNALPENR